MCTAHCAGMTWAGNKAWNPISSTSEWISKAAHYSCSLPIELTQSLTCRILVIQYIVQRSVWIFIIIFKSQCSVFKCVEQAFFCDSVQSFKFCAWKLKISMVFLELQFLLARSLWYANIGKQLSSSYLIWELPISHSRSLFFLIWCSCTEKNHF